MSSTVPLSRGSQRPAGWAKALHLLVRFCGWGVCWLATLGMAAAAVAWAIGYAPTPPVQWVNAFTAYVYLPAYGVLLLALFGDRRFLAGCSAAVVCWHVAVLLPTVAPRLPWAPPPIAAASPTQQVRVFYANVGKTNQEFDALFYEIRRADADVLVLTEFTEAWHNRFNATELPVEYPQHVHLTRYSPAATGVYSRLPVAFDDRVYQARRVVVRSTIGVGEGEFKLYAIHAPRPMNSPLHRYDEFWGIVDEELAGESGPLLLIGDFNATPYSLVYRRLTAERGLRDCHTLTGRGVATTWPNGEFLSPPIRIDHALVSPSLLCRAIEEGEGVGSDHKPLIVDLVVPPGTRPDEAPALAAASPPERAPEAHNAE